MSAGCKNYFQLRQLITDHARMIRGLTWAVNTVRLGLVIREER